MASLSQPLLARLRLKKLQPTLTPPQSLSAPLHVKLLKAVPLKVAPLKVALLKVVKLLHAALPKAAKLLLAKLPKLTNANAFSCDRWQPRLPSVVLIQVC